MPIYEYVCQSCAHRFEVKQKLSDPPVERCVRCGEAVNKVISAPAIMFKGTGWYVTDYSDKLKAPSASGSENGQSDAKTSAAGDGSSEKKDKQEQKTPVSGSSSDSAPTGSSSKETAAPAASGSTGGSSKPASGTGSSNTSKPSGSST